jgi:hypothetical protein
MHTVHIGTDTAYAYRTHTVHIRLVAGKRIVTMLTNFRTKQKQFVSRNTQLSHKRRAYERMREIKRVMFACSYLSCLCKFMCCCWCVVCSTVGTIYFFLSWCYFIDEKKSEMINWSNQQLFYECIVVIQMYHRCIIDSSIDASFWLICFLNNSRSAIFHSKPVFYRRFELLLVESVNWK